MRPETPQSAILFDQHVFQTVFLDNSTTSSALWSKDEINPEKVCPVIVHPSFWLIRISCEDYYSEMVEAAKPPMAALYGHGSVDGVD